MGLLNFLRPKKIIQPVQQLKMTKCPERSVIIKNSEQDNSTRQSQATLLKQESVIPFYTSSSITYVNPSSSGSNFSASSSIPRMFDMPNVKSREDIEKSAYFKWEQAGCPHGRDLEFWVAAEQD